MGGVMVGYNEIKINPATMLEAINLWLVDQFKDPPKAVSVVADSATFRDGFVVRVEKSAPVSEA
jgi:hypothetical protein